MTKRKRGAPRGNRNAFKHGFYSAAFKDSERRLLSRLSPADLSSEIDLIRIANFRLLQALGRSPAPLDVDRQLAILRAVTLSTQSITALLRAEQWMALIPGDSLELPALDEGERGADGNPASPDSTCLDLPSGRIDESSRPQSEI